VHKVGWEHCPYCHRQDIHLSRPKHWWEEMAGLLLLRTVRCHDCMRRFFCPLFAPPPKPLARVALKGPQKASVAEIDKKRVA
jgi:hypothetical protein